MFSTEIAVRDIIPEDSEEYSLVKRKKEANTDKKVKNECTREWKTDTITMIKETVKPYELGIAKKPDEAKKGIY